ncbi:ribonuclease H-like domain-containing protein [Tanacetum coccineum]|uniref:Ribonuclease H-like domain-containing protein n=1 Tax=Tanacetum coccineum TaxID=301880 RepID=A0ABQ4Z7K4_9ASTR
MSYSCLEEFQQSEFEGYVPKPSKSVSEDTSNKIKESSDTLLVEELVSDDKLEKKTVFPTVAKIEFVRPKQQEKLRNQLTAITIKGKGWLMLLRPQHVGFGDLPNLIGHPQKEDQGYVDSGCSRHMTENMSYLSNFKEFDEGYVTFRGGAKGVKINGKGTLKTGKLDFEDVYFVEELQFNLYFVKESQFYLFSVSEMCNKEQWKASQSLFLMNKKYCLVVTDDYSRFTWVFFLASKDETSDILKSFITEIGNLVDKKNTSNDEPQPSSDAGKKDDEELDNEQGATLPTTYLVPSTLNTRIHKDHSLDHVIGDVQSGVLTRRMTKTTNEQGFIKKKVEPKKVNPSIKISKLDRSYARRASAIQVTTDYKVTQKVDGFSSVRQVYDEILKKFGFLTIKTASTPIETSKPLHEDAEAEDVDVHLYRSMIGSLMPWNPKDSPFDSEAYSDSDYAGASLDMKSTTGVANDEIQVSAVGLTFYEGKGFSGRVTPLSQTMMVQAQEEGAYSEMPIMDVKSAFLYGTIEEEVYVCQPPRAWYETVSTYLLENGFRRGTIDKTLFIKKDKDDILLVQVYVDDIIFGSTKKSLCTEFIQDELQGEEVVAKKEVAKKEVSAADPVTTAGEVVTTASTTTTVYELTLAQTLIEIKAAKPKAVTIAATTTTTTRPKARGVVVQEPSEFKTTSSSSQASQIPQAKDKGKGKMVEPEKPLKKKDQIALDEELALRLQAEEQAELEKERVAQEEASRAANIEELDSIQAMIDANEQLAARLQAEEQEQFSIEEKSRMLVEMIAKRKEFFAAQRAAEQRIKPPTKT